jgi:hypothetical protein
METAPPDRLHFECSFLLTLRLGLVGFADATTALRLSIARVEVTFADAIIAA